LVGRSVGSTAVASLRAVADDGRKIEIAGEEEEEADLGASRASYIESIDDGPNLGLP
jgi:hypothetical protein